MMRFVFLRYQQIADGRNPLIDHDTFRANRSLRSIIICAFAALAAKPFGTGQTR
jgi:hypothetical protein